MHHVEARGGKLVEKGRFALNKRPVGADLSALIKNGLAQEG